MSDKRTTITPHVSKGRPRKFDRNVALNRALGVFWQRGYEPASIAELCTAMGINPPSLYAAFGNKSQLFMEAVLHYEEIYWNAAWDHMEGIPDVREAITGFFMDAARILTTQEAPCGCLVVIAAMNLSPEAKQVNEALRALRQEGKDCFLSRLKRALEDKQFPSRTDVEALAFTLNTILEGMSVQARDGVTRPELERIAATAMAILPGGASVRKKP